MATKIITKNSSTTTAIPTAADLVQGELAVNVTDKRLFTENSVGAIVEVGTNPSTLTVTGEITANGGIALGDGDVATFGDSDDLSIQHLGGNTYLTNTTGSLILRSDSFRVLNTANSEQILHGDANGAVTAYYDNAAKLATTATGIDVTGTATMDGLTVDAVSSSFKSTGATAISIIDTDVTNDPFKFNIENGGRDGRISVWQDIIFSNTGAGETVRIDTSGNVGIGVSAPNEKLESSGAIRVLGTTATSRNSGTLSFNGTLFNIESRGPDVSNRGTIGFYQATSNGSSAIQSMLLDASGNLLVGTTSSSGSKLYVSSNAGGATVGDFRNGSPTGSGMYIAAGDTASQYALRVADYANNHLMSVDGSGNVGIGTTTPAYQLTLSSNPSFWEAGLQTQVVGGNQVLKIVSDAFGGGGRTGEIEFHVSAVTTTPALKITANGEMVSIVSSGGFSYDARQQSTNGYGILSRFSGGGIGYMYAAYLDSPGAFKFYVTTDGAVYGNGTYGTVSDIKLKENIVPASSQWDDVKAIQLKNYSLIADNLDHADQLGVIAQDLEASGMGKLIDTLDDIDGDGASLGTVTKHVKYSVLHLKALGALQEAMAKIEDLTARLEALEGA